MWCYRRLTAAYGIGLVAQVIGRGIEDIGNDNVRRKISPVSEMSAYGWRNAVSGDLARPYQRLPIRNVHATIVGTGKFFGRRFGGCFKETVVHDKIVHLRNGALEVCTGEKKYMNNCQLTNTQPNTNRSTLTVVLVEETDELLGWSIDGHFHRRIVLVGEHRLEQLLAQAAALARLVHVEVQHTRGAHLLRVAVRIEHVQVLRADLQHADHAAAVLCKTTPPVSRVYTCWV